MLKEEWTQDPETETDVLSFIMKVKKRMELAREVVEKNARSTQVKQKEYYDRKVREMDLKSGDKVLLLLPSQMARRVGKVNYKMADKGGRRHINHLSR